MRFGPDADETGDGEGKDGEFEDGADADESGEFEDEDGQFEDDDFGIDAEEVA